MISPRRGEHSTRSAWFGRLNQIYSGLGRPDAVFRSVSHLQGFSRFAGNRTRSGLPVTLASYFLIPRLQEKILPGEGVLAGLP